MITVSEWGCVSQKERSVVRYRRSASSRLEAPTSRAVPRADFHARNHCITSDLKMADSVNTSGTPCSISRKNPRTQAPKNTSGMFTVASCGAVDEKNCTRSYTKKTRGGPTLWGRIQEKVQRHVPHIGLDPIAQVVAKRHQGRQRVYLPF